MGPRGLLISGVMAGLLAAGGSPCRGEAVLRAQLDTARDQEGTAWFALRLDLTAEPAPLYNGPLELALVVDLSASQAGEIRERSLRIARGLTAALGDGSRIRIWTSDGRSWMPAPAPVGSKDLDGALNLLAGMAPAGTSDLRKVLSELDSWAAGARATRKAVVFIGDGLCPAGRAIDEEAQSLAGRLAAARVPFHAVPIGPVVDLGRLWELAASTGGVVVTSDEGPVDGVVSVLIRSLREPAFYPQELRLGSEVAEFFPRVPAPLRAGRPAMVVGRWRPAAAMSVALSGSQDGRPIELAAQASIRTPTPGSSTPAGGSVDAAQLAQLCQWCSQRPDRPLLIDPSSIRRPEPAVAAAPASPVAEPNTGEPRADLSEIVRKAIADADRISRADPSAAVRLLKHSLELLQSSDPPPDGKRAELSRSAIESRLRELSRLERRDATPRSATARESTPKDARRGPDAAQLLARYSAILNRRSGTSAPQGGAGTRAAQAPAGGTTEARIRRALALPVTADFQSTPLTDVLAFLSDFAKIHLVTDAAGLREARVSDVVPVTIQTDAPSVGELLTRILEPLGLVHLVRDEVVWITSRERARAQVTTQVHPVGDLVVPYLSLGPGGTVTRISPFGGVAEDAFGGGRVRRGALDSAGGLSGGGGASADLSDEFVELIQKTINPDRWASAGGNASLDVFRRHLVVTADQETHERLAAMLDALRRSQPPQVTINAPPPDWDRHFGARAEPAVGMRGAVDVMVRDGRHDAVAAMLRAHARHRPAEPWMDEALALSLQLSGAPPAQVRQALLSLVDRMPDRLDVCWYVAELLDLVGQSRAAIDFLHQTAERVPGSVNTCFLALALAEEAGDVEGAAWSAEELLGRDWPRGGQAVHAEARRILSRFEHRLRAAGQAGSADRLRAIADAPRERDLQITIRWSGEADIDLCVIEPSGLVCSPIVPRTVGGGVLVSEDGGTSESYSAAQAFSGNYEIRPRRVWGMPTAGLVTVDIVEHAATASEKRQRFTLHLDQPEPITVRLDGGRRNHLVALSPDESLEVAVADGPASANPSAPSQRGRQRTSEPAALPASRLPRGSEPARPHFPTGEVRARGAPGPANDPAASLVAEAQRLRASMPQAPAGVSPPAGGLGGALIRSQDPGQALGNAGGGAGAGLHELGWEFNEDIAVPPIRSRFFRTNPLNPPDTVIGGTDVLRGPLDRLFGAHQGFRASLNSTTPVLTLPGNGATAMLFLGRQIPFITDVIPVVSNGAVAFDPVITVLNDGVTLQAQAIVSPDRRYVRMQLIPVFSTVQPVQSVRTVRVGAAAGAGLVLP